MSNTLMTAKNTFSEGLIMDFAPDNTQANTLTSALNATLLTFNGNEMSLLNDMGNGRVETARLPNGYIPIGTCEFGDIIYIVSYNPLTDKSLIGCFPSPERSISSEEVSDIALTLSDSDFRDSSTWGKLKATSVKKVLFGSKDLSPGDKYIVYSNGESIKTTGGTLSDFGNTSHQLDNFPKLLKINIVSIDDSGKITYLNSDTKWYNGKSEHDLSDKEHDTSTVYTPDDYYIKDLINNWGGKPDLDSYRNLVDSAYSIFQSKNAGKLAVLAELEKIDSFNCAYSVQTTLEEQNVNYKVYLHSSWTSRNNDINPCGLALLESRWLSNDTSNGSIGYKKVYKNNNKYYYGDDYVDSVSVPRFSEGYDIIEEFSRIYFLEGDRTESNSVRGNLIYDNYIKYPGDYPTSLKGFIDNTYSHATSYNYFINNNKDNIFVGWGNDENIKNLRDVTRINLVKKDDGSYELNHYYFNLDAFETKLKDGKTIKTPQTRGIDNTLYPISSKILTDDVVNNYFKKDVTTLLVDNFTLLTQLYAEDSYVPNDLSNFVWKIKVAPCMPYGVLEEFAVELTIDFSKVGKNNTELLEWRYWNQGTASTLTYGFDINLSNTTKVKEVTFDFYDNQGIAATYRSNQKSSYSGIFTELFGLGGDNTNYKFLKINSKGEPIYHCGQRYEGDYVDNLVFWDPTSTSSNSPILATKEMVQNNPDKIYLNDAGSIYPNFLYKVVIKITYGVVDELDNFIDGTMKTKSYSRWMWTNSMYNDNYYTDKDFDSLPLELNLGYKYKIQSNKNYKLLAINYFNKEMSTSSENVPIDTLGASVLFINQNSELNGNINVSLDVGLQQTYDTLYFTNDAINNLEANVQLGKSYMNIDEVKYSSDLGEINYVELQPIQDPNLSTSTGKLSNTTISDSLLKLMKVSQTGSGAELWTNEAYKNYINTFSLDFDSSIGASTVDKQYTDEEGNTLKITKEYKITGSQINSGVNLTLTGISFTKQCFSTVKPVSGTYPIVLSLVRTKHNRDLMNLGYDSVNNCFYFRKVVDLFMEYKDDAAYIKVRNFSNADNSKEESTPKEVIIDDNLNYSTHELLKAINNKQFKSPIVLVCWGMAKDSAMMHIEHAAHDDTNFGVFHPYDEHNNHWDGPGYDDNNRTNTMLYHLALNKPLNYFYILGDSMGKSSEGQRINVSQIPYRPTSHLMNIRRNDTMANMVASMFSLIYYQSSELLNYKGAKFDNLCYPDNYSEIWGKHILITLKLNNPYIEQDSINDMVAFNNGISLNNYTKSLKTETVDKEANNYNINVKLADTTLLIDFKYSIPKTESLKILYEDKLENIATIIYDSTKNDSYTSSRTYDDQLYYMDNGELKPLISDFTYYACNFTNTDSDMIVSFDNEFSYTVPNLGDLVEYDKDQLIGCRNYPRTKVYNITVGEKDTNKNNWYTDISIDAQLTGFWNSFKLT